MFSLEHHNYVRWLPVHLTQIIDIKEMHPSLCKKFNDGKFTVQKSNRRFPKIVLDQNHEQFNADIKSVGRAIGLTENDAALQRWLIIGLEVARLLQEFTIFHTVDEEGVLEHHNSSASVAK